MRKNLDALVPQTAGAPLMADDETSPSREPARDDAHTGSARVREASSRGGPVRIVVPVVLAAAVLTVLLGRQVFGDTFVVLAAMRHIRRLPQWWPVAAALVGAAVLALGVYSFGFGRRRALVAVAVVLLVALFAAPGAALGWASGYVGRMGGSGSVEQRTTVANAKRVLQHPLPNAPVNVLLLGIDHASPGDPGRSDSQILVRLDPQTGTISMLSLPRDLYWNVPGLGYTKMNAAYTYGGVKLAVQTFSAITGVPIDHFVRVDFGGFWHIVDILHGVYLPIDHRYYNTEGNGFQPIDLQPGYQLVKAKQALNFVRFRHDQEGDFTRMVRQQLFLREVQRQAKRWSGSWTTVVRMVKAISSVTTTDLDSLSRLLPIVDMALSLDTSHIYQVHVTGSTPTIGGVSYVVASRAAIASAVWRFEHPPVHTRAATARPGTRAGASGAGRQVGSPAASPSSTAGGASTSGSSSPRATSKNVVDWPAWRSLASRTSLTLEAPTTWASGLGWDTAGVPFRAYRVQTPQGRNVAAAVAVGTVTGASGVTEYWGVQALHWTDPPAIANPSRTIVAGGHRYLLFSQDKALHMVAWQENGSTYWVINTLDNALPNPLLLKLAESCAPLVP